MALREKIKQPRTIDTNGTTHGPFYEDIVKGRSRQDIALLKATIEPDVEKALIRARNALEGGADVNAKDGSFGVSALMLASSKGRMELVELLVKKGVDVNARDNEELTALWYARRANHMDVMAFLQENGAKG